MFKIKMIKQRMSTSFDFGNWTVNKNLINKPIIIRLIICKCLKFIETLLS